MTDDDPGTWRAGIYLNEWALPVYVRWRNDPNVWYVAVHVLCFCVSFERWKV